MYCGKPQVSLSHESSTQRKGNALRALRPSDCTQYLFFPACRSSPARVATIAEFCSWNIPGPSLRFGDSLVWITSPGSTSLPGSLIVIRDQHSGDKTARFIMRIQTVYGRE